MHTASPKYAPHPPTPCPPLPPPAAAPRRYKQELRRSLNGFQNFAVSFTVVSILTGLTGLYGE